MANEPLINRRPKVFYRPAASAGVGAWTDVSAHFYKFELAPKVASIPTGAFTTVGNKSEKGDPDHDLSVGINHTRAWTDFSSLLAVEFAAEGDTEFMFKARGAVATSGTNPYVRCKIKLTSLGKLGGAKNEISRIEESFKTEGQLEISTTAGDPPADGSFAVWV